MNTQNGNFILPRVRKMTLRHFSLFTHEHDITVLFPDGVFCLAGANGLGKSTFLSALNYGLTGVVPEPQRKFESVNEYYKDNLKFASAYFEGRIEEKDREGAEVSLEFTLGDYRCSIIRGLFEQEQLRSLSIVDMSTKEPIVSTDEFMPPADMHKRYADFVTQRSGLDSFEQLVFLQSFVFTFDERRHLLFWDQKVLEQALYLAFGVNPADAKRADALRREAEKADSRARNASWQASDVRKRIREIEDLITNNSSNTDNDAEDLYKQHELLAVSVKQLEDDVERGEQQLRDESLRLSALSAEQASLRAQYAQEYDSHLRRQGGIRMDPVIASSLSNSQCEICGTHSDDVRHRLQLKIESGRCPLCDSEIPNNLTNASDLHSLQGIDERLSVIKPQLDDTLRAVDRHKNSLNSARQLLALRRSELDMFERDNEKALSRLYASKSPSQDTEYVLETFRTQMNRLLQEKEDQYARRDIKRADRRKLQEILEKSYSNAEAVFVPLFKDLAVLFLGIDLTVRMDRSSTGLNLVLSSPA
jgi:hypothetical protein